MKNKFIIGEFFNKISIEEKLFPNAVLINELFMSKLITPNKENVVKIDERIGKLLTRNLPEPLNDSDTQKYAESAPLNENELLQILFLLISDYNDDTSRRCSDILGTKYYHRVAYHFHVKLFSGELLAVSLSHFGPFYLTAHKFDAGVSGGMFCFLKSWN